MSIIGTQITDTRTGETFTVSGAVGNGFVLTPTAFGPNEIISTGGLAERFSVTATPAKNVSTSDASSYVSLSTSEAIAAEERFRSIVLAPRPVVPLIAPEDVFRVADPDADPEARETAAQRIAASIVANPEKRAAAQRGDLPMHGDVIRAVRALLDAQADHNG